MDYSLFIHIKNSRIIGILCGQRNVFFIELHTCIERQESGYNMQDLRHMNSLLGTYSSGTKYSCISKVFVQI